VSASPSKLYYKVRVLLYLGLNDQAASVIAELRAELANHPHALSIAMSRLTFVWSAYLLGDLDDYERESAEVLAYCVE
jgi:hypothetical protein